MGITSNDPDQAAVLRYIAAHGQAARSLGKAISYCDELLGSASFTDRPRIELEKANLVSQLTKINADYEAFVSESTEIDPPSAAQVTAVQQAAQDLDNQIANAVGVDGLVQAATTLLNAYQGAAASAPGAAMEAALTTLRQGRSAGVRKRKPAKAASGRAKKKTP